MTDKRTILATVGVALLLAVAGCSSGGAGNNSTGTTTTTMATTSGGMNETTTGMNETTTGMNETTTGMNETTTGMNETTTGMNNTTGGGMNATASVTFTAQQSNGSSVTVQSVNLSQGGYVVIHAVSNGSAGAVLGHSAYLEPGSHENVSVPVDSLSNGTNPLIAMAHMDTNGDQQYDFPSNDGPYTSDGSPVIDQANVTVE